MTHALIVGLAATGEAVARVLRREGWDVVVADDRPGGPAYEQRRSLVGALGGWLCRRP